MKKSGMRQYMLRCPIEGYELAVFPNGRAIIKGAKDETEARAVYARYVGL